MAGGFGPSEGRKESALFSIVSPLDPNPDPKYKPYIHFKYHHGQFLKHECENVNFGLSSE